MVDQSVHPESKSMIIYTLLYTQEQANKQLCHFFIPTTCGRAHYQLCINIRMAPESNTTRPKRNQSEIAKKWWNSKRMKVEEFHSLLAERDHLLTEVKVLKQEKEILVAEVQQKDDELQEIWSGAMNGIFSALNPHGGLKKITQKASRVAAVGVRILAVLAILLSRTQATTKLRVVCEALFDNAIFGVEATKVILKELYQKYFLSRCVRCLHHGMYCER